MNKKMWALRITASLAVAALVAMRLLKVLPTAPFIVLEIAVLVVFFILQYVWNGKGKGKDEIRKDHSSGER